MSQNPKTLDNEEYYKLTEWYAAQIRKAAFKKVPTRNFAMVCLMLDAGLRVGEVTRLNISDLWFGGHAVSCLVVRPEIAKSDIERTIPLSARLTALMPEMFLQVWSLERSIAKDFAFFGYCPHFRISVRQVERIVKNDSLRAIGRRITPHVLRHTFATRLMRKTNSRVVQALLGHKSLTSTQIYTHPNHEDLTAAIKSLHSGP